jgi:hypothetical protein
MSTKMGYMKEKRTANKHNSIGYIKEHQLDDSGKSDACETVLNK